MSNTAAIILAAGMGTRMESALPKVMHPVAGRPMVLHVLETAAALSPEKTIVVAGPDMDELATLVATHDLTPDVALQTERLGTGHAVMAARDALGDFDGTVMVLYGDTPLIEAETLVALRDARTEAGADVAVLGFRPLDPGAYGRLITDEAGELIEIVEARDATEDQLLVDLCNSGVMAIDGAKLGGLLDGLTNDNAKGEYYLTDIIALARANGGRCMVVEGDEEEFLGVNSRAELADAEDLMQNRLRRVALAGGATLIDPATVYFFWDTTLGRDVTVGPNVVFGPGVTVADNVQIKAFSHLEGASVAAGAIIGPFARLRPGATIGEDAQIGNFVEIKNATIAAGAKANHLSYIGDATVGAKANIGAGTITCNYDGYTKSLTEIGAGAFIGSNTALVAPVKVGDGAVTGAGSVITKDVEADALAVTRSEQKAAAGWATKQRDRKARD
ncbi:MAG: bifunctional UDP-N-acetylglucosamine diphosphorylase/glucosamine-1-phosphate N-acetyltransferase GlmU [Rhodospirillaceae bacterium]